MRCSFPMLVRPFETSQNSVRLDPSQQSQDALPHTCWMTLVAAFSPYGVPVLVADILTSSGTPPAREVKLPAGVTEKQDGSDKHFVAGVRQKAWIPDPRIALAWAGSLVQARAAARDVRDWISSENNLSSTGLLNLFHSIPDEDKTDLAIVGWCNDPDGIIRQVQFCTTLQLNHPHFGVVAAAGSGAEELPSILGSPLGGQGIDNVLVGSVLSALQVACYVAGREVSYGQVSGFWGGGIEVVAFIEGRFTKVEDIVYVFWDVNVDATEPTIRHKSPLIFQRYWGGDLFFHRVDLTESDGGSIRGALKNYIVRPLLSEHSQALRAPPPSFGCDIICSHVHIGSTEMDNEGIVNITFQENRSLMKFESTIRDTDMVVNIGINSNLPNSIIRDVVEYGGQSGHIPKSWTV